jgi:hypothetical protein
MSGDVVVGRPTVLDVPGRGSTEDGVAGLEDDDEAEDRQPVAPVAPPARTGEPGEPTSEPEHVASNGAIAAAYDEARLRILRSLERGEIDVDEAGRRLEVLDEGPDDPSAADADTAPFDTTSESSGA